MSPCFFRQLLESAISGGGVMEPVVTRTGIHTRQIRVNSRLLGLPAHPSTICLPVSITSPITGRGHGKSREAAPCTHPALPVLAPAPGEDRGPGNWGRERDEGGLMRGGGRHGPPWAQLELWHETPGNIAHKHTCTGTRDGAQRSLPSLLHEHPVIT